MKRERSAAEREQARFERETKRAAREGRPPPAALPPTELPPEEMRVEAPPEPVAEPEPLAEAEPLASPEPPAPPAPERPSEPPAASEPEAVEPLREPELEPPDPVAVEPPYEDPQPVAAEPPLDDPEPPEPESAPFQEPLAADDSEQDTEPDLQAIEEPVEPEHEPEPVEKEPEEPEPEEPEPEEPEPETEEPEPLPVARGARPLHSPAPDAPEASDRKRFGRRRRREEPAATRPSPPKPPPAYRPSIATAEARSAAAQQVLERRRNGQETSRRGRRIGPALGVLLAILAALTIAVGWFAFSLFQPFKGSGSGAVRVTIAQGESVGDIAKSLERRGVISSAFFFQARATIAGRRDDFKAGKFTLKNGMSHMAAMDAISKGPPADVTQIAIPEGRDRRQVAGLVKGKLPGDYLALTRSSKSLDTRRYGAPRGATLEGFLFPATFELKKGSRMSALVDQQVGLFKRNFAGVDLAAAKRRKLTAYDVLIIASMIEQEAQLAKERPIIASVIYNRLRDGIPLGIDATIRFATNNRTRPLTQSQLATDSPYNTRTRRGLPPGPIGSPGLASIRAAAKPANTKFLFYVVKPETCGEHAFSRTDAEFQRDVARYNSARAKRGGKSPTRC